MGLPAMIDADARWLGMNASSLARRIWDYLQVDGGWHSLYHLADRFSATRSATQKALCRLYDAGAVDKRSVDFNGTRRQGLTHAAEWRAVEIEED